MLAELLTRALGRAGIPITGVSIGHPTDRTTWLIHYRPIATAPQRTQGEAIKASFDEATEANTVRAEDEINRFNDEKLIKAVAIWCAGKFGVPLATARQEILTIYRGL